MVNDRITAASNVLMAASEHERGQDGKMKDAAAGDSVRRAPRLDAVRGAHRVLASCLPGMPLPTELTRLRAMLDAHMFGRDNRTLRDDAVRVAWQIDSLRLSPSGG